jgi:hypothetical protein
VTVNGDVTLTLPESAGVIQAHVSGEKSCPTDSKVAYVLDGNLAVAEVSVGRTTVSLRNVVVSLVGSGSNAKSKDFSAISWEGSVSGTVNLVASSLDADVSSLVGDATLSASVEFSVKSGEALVGSVVMSGEYSVAVSPVTVSGTAELTFPCSAKHPVMMQGDATVNVESKDVTIDDADGTVSYDCVANTVTVNATAPSISAGPVRISSASVDVVVDRGAKTYKGVVRGIVGLDFMLAQVPGLPKSASAASASSAPASEVVFSSAKGLESVTANVEFAVTAASSGTKGDADAMEVTVTGWVAAVYPCVA